MPSDEMTTLVTLPDELLLHTIECLSIRSIRSFALTFNKRITSACLVVLTALEARRRSHEQKMLSRFGTLKHPYRDFQEGDDGPYGARASRRILGLPLEAESYPFGDLGRFGDLNYLDLDGNLTWLQPLDKVGSEIQAMRYVDPGRPMSAAISQQEMRDLVVTAAGANIYLPPAFVKFFYHQHLLDRMPGCDYDDNLLFLISGDLQLAPKSIDGSLGGCMLQFCRDEEAETMWSLYIEPGPKGIHCVLNVPTHASDFADLKDLPGPRFNVKVTDEEKAEARAKGMQIADMGNVFRPGDVLNAVDFEEWLAVAYYEGWLFALSGEEEVEYDEAMEPLREYVKRVRLLSQPKDVAEAMELDDRPSGDMMEF